MSDAPPDLIDWFDMAAGAVIMHAPIGAMPGHGCGGIMPAALGGNAEYGPPSPMCGMPGVPR